MKNNLLKLFTLLFVFGTALVSFQAYGLDQPGPPPGYCEHACPISDKTKALCQLAAKWCGIAYEKGGFDPDPAHVKVCAYYADECNARVQSE